MTQSIFPSTSRNVVQKKSPSIPQEIVSCDLQDCRLLVLTLYLFSFPMASPSMEFPVISSLSPSEPNASLFWAVEKPPCVLKTVLVNDHNEWLFTPLVLPLPLLSSLMCLSFSWSYWELLFKTAIKEQIFPKTTCY